MFRFPWGDMHSLNLGWFLQKFNELREDWATAEAGIDGALDAEIQKAEDALSDVFDARDAAAASATAAAGSASAAGTSATAAQNSATAAASSATLANQKATAAGLSEAAAAQSATQAGNSATAAAGSATTASNAATNAAASETAAGNSASAAAGSATAAGNSATAAAGSATAAGNSAAAAEQSAQDAAASAASATGGKITSLNNALNRWNINAGTQKAKKLRLEEVIEVLTPRVAIDFQFKAIDINEVENNYNISIPFSIAANTTLSLEVELITLSNYVIINTKREGDVHMFLVSCPDIKYISQLHSYIGSAGTNYNLLEVDLIEEVFTT